VVRILYPCPDEQGPLRESLDMTNQARPISFIREAIKDSGKVRHIAHGEKLAISGHRSNRSGIPQEATAWTTVGFALEDGKCPASAVIATLEKMKKDPYASLRGIYLNAIAITKHRMEKPPRTPLAVGDIISLEGCICRIENAPNENFSTVELTEEELRALYEEMREAA
jgi:hypothetical protein